MAEMVVNFLEHLLDAKVRKNMAAEELASTKATIASARADLVQAQQGFQQACKAFDAAHQDALAAGGKVSVPAGAAQCNNAQVA
ncbi:hypothetical protein D3C71_1667910 [compost metagenome]